MTTEPLYLDHASTTPLAAEVLDAMLPFLKQQFGNPASLQHLRGQAAHDVVEQARNSLLRDLGAAGGSIIFTGSATEANNLVIQGFARRHLGRSARIFVGATEHKSVLEPAQAAQKYYGASVTVLPVDRLGMLDLGFLRKAVQSDSKRPTLVATMLINNEIPVRHPVTEIVKICSAHGAFVHCDAVQAAVREPIRFADWNCASMTISAHKLYGPKGIGALVLADGDRGPAILPVLTGGEQEGGLRPGTLNPAAIVGFARAISLLEERRPHLIAQMVGNARQFVEFMGRNIPGFQLTIPLSGAVPGLVNFWIEGINAQSLLYAIPEICLSRGATCSTGGEKFSHVPGALGLPVEVAANVLRASFGAGTSENESIAAAERIAAAVKALRASM